MIRRDSPFVSFLLRAGRPARRRVHGRPGYAIACRFIEEGTAVTVFGSRQETADAFVFLASDMASYVTGAVIPVDGAARS